jgi:NADH:ubiquinone oxidoreductase subunit 5 (subunit L)/multisubunit Na+/H+ antiporter MnhA subunit
MLLGGVQMLQQQSLKRILAFSSVAQMGYALLGLAIGTPLALAAAAMHLLHHALVKTALFMGAGMITSRTHVHHVGDGGRLAQQMPLTFLLFALASLSLSGIPFFSGYISKTMLEEAALAVDLDWLAYVAIFGSMLTLAGLLRLIWYVFLARPQTPAPAPIRETPLLALLPIAILTLGSIAVGSFPGWSADHLAWPAARSLIESERYATTVLALTPADEVPILEIEAEHPPNAADWHHWLPPAMVLLGGGLLAYLTVRQAAATAQPAWTRPARIIGQQLRRWHSGIVNDYALWTAFGTMVMLITLLTITWLY